MKLDTIRTKIDEIDLELLALLEERMELGLRARRYKTNATDPRREFPERDPHRAPSRVSCRRCSSPAATPGSVR